MIQHDCTANAADLKNTPTLYPVIASSNPLHINEDDEDYDTVPITDKTKELPPFIYQPDSGLYSLPKPISRKEIIQTAKSWLASAVHSAEALPHQTPLLIDYFHARIAHYEQQVIAVLFFNAELHLMAYDEFFFGTDNMLRLNPEIIIDRALGYRANAIVLAHNRPSELTARFSMKEVESSRQLLNTLTYLNIGLLDHILIASDEGCSLKQTESWMFEGEPAPKEQQ